jgi:hypothetical protein
MAGVLAGAAGCSEPMSIIRPTVDGGMDGGGGGGTCENGQWECVGGTQQARQCNGRGGYLRTVDCSTMGRSCIAGIGCGVCRPGATQCKEGALNTTQECAMDGSGWIDGQTCDEANGEYCRGGRCVTRCGDLGNTYLGCEYWPTITTNHLLDNGFFFSAVIANPNGYDVNVRVEGGSLTSPRERVIPAGQVGRIDLPWVSALSNNDPARCPITGCVPRSARVPSGAFRLRSNGPVAVYQFNPLQFARVPNPRTQDDFSFTNDASLLLPQNVLGKQYIAVGTTNGPLGWLPAGAPPAYTGAFLSIVSAQNEGTNNVTVRLTAPVQDPANPTRTLPIGEHSFQLDRGEVLQLVMPNIPGDLTGTRIDSELPIAVFSGNSCTSSPMNQPACDHVEEQLFPTTAWGRTYAVTPVRDRPTAVSHFVRIIAQRDGVTLTFDGISAPASCARTLNQGQFCEFESREAFQVTGSQPILVAQFLRGLGSNPVCQCNGSTCPIRPDCVGDPAMVLEVPTDQYRNFYNFLIPDSYQQNYVNVTAASGAMITLDGNPIAGASIPTGSNLVTYFLNVPPGQHTLRAATPSERFGIKVYGVASFTSYAFPGGLDLAAISPPG